MEKQMKCSHCGQVFTTIPDRNSFGEVCLCNTCLQQVPNLTITSTKLKSTHLSTKQLDEAIQAIDQQLDKGHFSQDIKEGIHTLENQLEFKYSKISPQKVALEIIEISKYESMPTNIFLGTDCLNIVNNKVKTYCYDIKTSKDFATRVEYEEGI